MTMLRIHQRFPYFLNQILLPSYRPGTIFWNETCALDRHGLWPRDDLIASDLAFSCERSAAGGNTEQYADVDTYSELF